MPPPEEREAGAGSVERAMRFELFWAFDDDALTGEVRPWNAVPNRDLNGCGVVRQDDVIGDLNGSLPWPSLNLSEPGNPDGWLIFCFVFHFWVRIGVV